MREKEIYKERQGGGGVIDGGHAKEREKEREEIERGGREKLKGRERERGRPTDTPTYIDHE